jgi:amidohydrolase
VLGTALYFAHDRDQLPGPLRFIFQPAEEAVPGGALLAIDGGALEGVSAILGLHCDPSLIAGRIALRSGAISSAADMATIVLNGPGGHTARPDETVDMVALAASVVSELPGRVATASGDPDSVRIVFGMIRAGEAANVIPTHATLRASVRTPSPDVWERLPDAFASALTNLLDGTGAEHTIEYTHGVPPVVNEALLTELVARAAARVLNDDAIVPARQSWGGDDFAWYTREVPATFFRVGVGDPSRLRPAQDLHSGAFDVDESAIDVALSVLTASTSEYFGQR